MMRDGVAIGVIGVARPDPGEFSATPGPIAADLRQPGRDCDREYPAVQRLNESLAQQTATAEVLGVINASPGNLTPVFETMVEKACGCARPRLVHCRFSRTTTTIVVATCGGAPGLSNFVTQSVSKPAGSVASLMRGGEAVIHIPDITVVGPEFRSPVSLR